MKRHSFSATIALTIMLLWGIIAAPQHSTALAQEVVQPSPRPTLTPIPPVEQPTMAPVTEPAPVPQRNESPAPTPVPTRRPAFSIGLSAISPVVPTTMVQPDGSIITVQDQSVSNEGKAQLAANPNLPTQNLPSASAAPFWSTPPFMLLVISIALLSGVAVARRRAAR